MEQSATHSNLSKIIDAIPDMIHVHEIGSVMAVCTTTEVIYIAVLIGENKLKEDHVNIPLNPNDGFGHVLKSSKRIVADMPDSYGESARFVGIPVKDERGQIVGAYGYSKPIKTQVELQQTSELVVESSNNIALSTEKMQGSASVLTKQMNQLSNAQKEMLNYADNTKSMLQLINNIAKSSRILGLNAGIEAARSGAASKGFSVVASEITNLANQSANSVHEINSVMENLTNQVLEISRIVEDTSQISEQQREAINEIAEALEKLSIVSEKVGDLSMKI